MGEYKLPHVIPSSFTPNQYVSLRDWKASQVRYGVTYSDFGPQEPTFRELRRPLVKLEFQGHYVAAKIRYPSDRKWTNGLRGKITSFSAQSRTRLFDLVNRLDVKYKPVFLTLTYGDDYPSMDRAKENLRAFLERIRRRKKCDKASAIWRVEPQERGAPHFHLIFFNLPFIPMKEVQTMWSEIIGEPEPFTRIELVRSRRGIMFYVSKYIAKLPDAGQSGFIYPTYLHAYELKYGPCIGRQWGVFNKKLLPYAPKLELTYVYSEVGYGKLRELAIAQYPRIGDYKAKGFRLYVDNAKEWYNAARHAMDRPYKTKLLSRLGYSGLPLTL